MLYIELTKLNKVSESDLERSPELDSYSYTAREKSMSKKPPKSTLELLSSFIGGNITPTKKPIIDLTCVNAEIGNANQKFRKAEADLHKKTGKTFEEMRTIYAAKEEIPRKSFLNTRRQNQFIEAFTEYTRLEFLETFRNVVEQREVNEASAKELLKRYIYIRENSSNKLADYRSLIDINLKIQLLGKVMVTVADKQTFCNIMLFKLCNLATAK